MLTLKIRVPYKEGQLEYIMERLEPSLLGNDDILTFGIIDNKIQIDFNNGKAPDTTLDLRLLEIIGG